MPSGRKPSNKENSKMRTQVAKQVARIQEIDLERGNYYQCTEGNDLDGWVKLFCDKHAGATSSSGGEQKRFPAVDLASGWGVWTAAAALRFREPVFPATLDWYPTERIKSSKEDGDSETRRGLTYLAEEATAAEGPLFRDEDGWSVCQNDTVVLRGLSAAKFNNRQGIVQHKDPEQDGRFAVQLVDEKRQKQEIISVKRENLFSADCTLLENRILRGMTTEAKRAFFQELLDRICHLDLRKSATWSNLEHLYGKCAVVTCTSQGLVRCAGYQRAPQIWQEALQLADKLLTPDGLVVLFDKFQLRGFGNSAVMESYAYDNGLQLIVEQAADAHDNSPDFAMMVWRKIAVPLERFDRIAYLDRMLKSGEGKTTYMWHPKIPKEEEEEDGDDGKVSGA